MIEHVALPARMDLPRAETIRVQTASGVFKNTALRPADCYVFTDGDIAPSVVRDLSERTYKYNHSTKCVCMCVCMCMYMCVCVYVCVCVCVSVSCLAD